MKKNFNNIVDNNNFIKKSIESSALKNIPIPKISLNEYLASYSRRRVLDHVIKKWHSRKYPIIFERTRGEWDEIIQIFLSETE